jgi:tetratricopeptide (TPR) repeat protein
MMVVEDSSSREKVISRLLTETDVFIKYGLYDKAIEHLQQVFDHAPGHLDGREKLKDLYLQMGEVERAVLELIYLADVYAEANPETSIAYLEHILQLMPGYEAAEERLRLFGIEPPSADLDTSAPESQEENQELSMSIEDALEGSVEIEESSDLLAQSQVALLVGQGPYEHTIETSSSHEMVAPSAGGVALDEELEEVEFFILQGLMEEARNMLMELSQSFPGNPLILEKFAEIDGSIESGRLVDNSFDLSAQIPNELQHDADRSTKAEDEPVKDVFEQFKQGVAEQVDVGDADTHYDLGVAYKEMGLIEDAVAEFELARENPEREALAQTMIGHCYVQAGQQTEAINAYKRGLYAFRKSQNEELELYYSLGSTYLALSDPREALYYFQKVVKREPNFRDVQSRISSIESGEPSDDAP